MSVCLLQNLPLSNASTEFVSSITFESGDKGSLTSQEKSVMNTAVQRRLLLATI